MIPTLKRFGMNFFRLWGFWYLVTALLLGGLINPERIIKRRLDYIQFATTYPLEFYNQKATWNRQAFRTTILYYTLLNSIAPSARGYEMIGYCYYQIHEEPLAIKNYKKALRLAPQFLWLNYNIGVIYFKNKKYGKALPYFESINKTSFQDLFIGAAFTKISHQLLEQRQTSYKKLIKFITLVSASARQATEIANLQLKSENSMYSNFNPTIVLHPWASLPIGR